MALPKMVLGVNGIRLLGQRSGVGRVIEAILRCMETVEHPFRSIRVYSPRPLPADVRLPACAENVVLPSPLPPGLWEQFVLPRGHGPRNLLFCPSYVIPLLARCPTFLVHLGSYEGYPQDFSWWALNKARVIYALSARRATVVSTLSEHSRRDMSRFYHIPAEKIEVIPAGVDTTSFRPMSDPVPIAAWRRATFGADVPFIVYVGKPIRRRNLPSLLEAFAASKKAARIPHKLLLVGTGLPGTTPVESVIERLGMQREIITLSYASHEEMVLIYNAASLLVYPSSYEGFGLPVLEAMACGTPAIALNNTAFPEFAGGVALLLEDAAPSTLQNAIESVLSDSEQQAQMRAAGPERATAYDWHSITGRYVELMKKALRRS
ncbi:MAG: glycosyltransferase family 4 protein [Chthoniobacterales bacterium]